jgi:hypothetical protein
MMDGDTRRDETLKDEVCAGTSDVRARAGAVSRWPVAVIALTALAVALSPLVLGAQGTVRDPDVRVDSSVNKTRTGLSRIDLDGNQASAVFLERKVSPGLDPFFTRSLDEGQTWSGPDVRLNVNFEENFLSNEVSDLRVGKSGTTVYAIFVHGREVDVDRQGWLTESQDSGVTWDDTTEGELVIINQAKDGNSDISDTILEEYHNLMPVSPTVAHVVWSDNRPSVSQARNVFIRTTTDGGATWNDEVQINEVDLSAGNPTESSERSGQVSACADSLGNVYAVWQDTRSSTDPDDITRQPGRIVFSRSVDQGATWSAEERLDATDGTPGTESALPHVTCRDDGTVLIAWEDERSGDKDVLYNKSGDFGASWSIAEARVESGPASTNAGAPRIGMSDTTPERIYVAWEDDRDGSVDLLFRASPDGGETWNAEQRANTGTTAGSQAPLEWDFAVDDGMVVVAWTDNRNAPGGSTKPDTFAVSSTDGGFSFAPEERLDLGTTAGQHKSGRVDLDAQSSSYVAIFEDFRNDPELDDNDGDIFSGGADFTPDPLDTDGDGIADTVDSCAGAVNPEQLNKDFDGSGDVCDPFFFDPLNDVDGDGSGAELDNCAFVTNADQADGDGDGIGDACDLCNGTVEVVSRDLDGDGIGDACDADVDGDLSDNGVDGDDDDDGVLDGTDVCVFVPDGAQYDEDGDLEGDACDTDDLKVQALVLGPEESKSRLGWERESNAESYNVYFGLVDRFAAGDPGHCYRPDMRAELALAPDVPQAGQAYYFLATGVDSGSIEGSPGLRDQGTMTPRSLPANCDQAAASDWDSDGTLNDADLCPLDAGATGDLDFDGIGDLCDLCTDTDGDGFGTGQCPLDICPNDALNDADLDGLCADVDNCPSLSNPAQYDLDLDGIGNVFDDDTDGDGQLNTVDTDDDGDGIADGVDLCQFDRDPGQLDTDGDGEGNACDFDDEEIWNVVVTKGAQDVASWTAEPGAQSYNVYSGSVSSLAVGQPYGNCDVSSSATASADVSADPLPGDPRFYLVTGTFAGGEGLAGKDSAGNVRTVTGCP